MVKYIIEFLFCSAAFMALYKLLLEGRVAHLLARNYLVVTMFLSLLIPLLELPLYPAETIYYPLPLFEAEEVTVVQPALAEVYDESVAAEVSAPTVDWSAVLTTAVWVIYFLVVILNLARFVWRLYVIGKLRRHSELSVYELYTLAVSDQVREPFSFWQTIYVNRLLRGREFEQVIVHELSHIRHHHTAERLTFECVRCVAWFNPFVWLAGSSLVEVHEWQADSDVLSEGYDVYEYRRLIFQQLYGYNPNITSGLSSQTSKKRFLMMTNFKKGKFSFVRLCAVLPVVAVLIFAFGAVRADGDVVPQMTSEGVDMQAVAAPENFDAQVVISSSGEIEYNGKRLSLEELHQQLVADSEKIQVLNIKTEKGVRMGVLNDVKMAARKAKVFRICYGSQSHNAEAMLPPLTEQSTSKVKILPPKAEGRNYLMLFVNAQDKVMTTLLNGDMGVVDMAQLKQVVKQFVDNSERVYASHEAKIAHYSDFEWTTFNVEGQGTIHYPVSKGCVSIVATRDTSADKYIEISNVVYKAYSELRDELSLLYYDKRFANLDDKYRSFIMQAIPIRIYDADSMPTVEPAQRVSVAVSSKPKAEAQPAVVVTTQEQPVVAEEPTPVAEPQQSSVESVTPSAKTGLAQVENKITTLPDGEFRLLSIGSSNFPDYLLKKFFQSMPTITVKGNKVIVSNHRCDDFIKPGTYDYKIFDDGVLSLIGKSTQGTMPIKLKYNGNGKYEMEILRSITYNGNRIESLVYYLGKWTSRSKTNLTGEMQREEKIPAGHYQASGFDTKWEWTRVNDKAAKYIMFTAPTFIFGDDNSVEVISPDNNDYIKSGRYTYQMLLDDKKIEPWLVTEKGKIVLTNKDNTYTYPCVVTRAHNVRDALSYDLKIYFNHNISNIDIDVKFISFNSFE